MSLKFSSPLAWRVLLATALYPSVVPLYDFFIFYFSPLGVHSKDTMLSLGKLHSHWEAQQLLAELKG